MKKPLKLPKFKNEDEEREFWTSIDLDEYFEPNDFELVSKMKLSEEVEKPLMST